MLAMERADKERNRLILVKHTHIYNTRIFSHSDVSNGESRHGEKQVTSGQSYTDYTTQDYSVKLTN